MGGMKGGDRWVVEIGIDLADGSYRSWRQNRLLKRLQWENFWKWRRRRWRRRLAAVAFLFCFLFLFLFSVCVTCERIGLTDIAPNARWKWDSSRIIWGFSQDLTGIFPCLQSMEFWWDFEDVFKDSKGILQGSCRDLTGIFPYSQSFGF